MYKIGLSTNEKVLSEELFEKYHKAGIEAMEISLAPADYAVINYEQVRVWAEKFNITLWSLHLPFTPFSEIELSDSHICKATIGYYEELIKKASSIGIDKFVVHPSGEPIEENERNERIKCSKESLAILAEIAKRNNAVIAVENLPRSCIGKNSDEILELISGSKELMVCFDTNHLLEENTVDFIHKIANRIITTHISDYDLINERHWLPGEGKLDWQKILNAFKDIGYNGRWLYEIGFSCPKTILRNRDLTCDDFVRNANEIFNNKEITVFSSKKDGLGMRE